jgi:hypothetical protein
MWIGILLILLFGFTLYFSYFSQPASTNPLSSMIKRIAAAAFTPTVTVPPQSKIIVSVASKNPSSSVYGKGISVGYEIQVLDEKGNVIQPNTQTNALVIPKGSLIVQRDRKDNHPIVLTKSENHKDLIENVPQNFFDLQKISTSSLPTTFYLQCGVHPDMGFQVTIA